MSTGNTSLGALVEHTKILLDCAPRRFATYTAIKSDIFKINWQVVLTIYDNFCVIHEAVYNL